TGIAASATTIPIRSKPSVISTAPATTQAIMAPMPTTQGGRFMGRLPSSERGGSSSLADAAAEADVSRRRVHRLALPGRRPVAEAVVGRAQVRPALDPLPRGGVAG